MNDPLTNEKTPRRREHRASCRKLSLAMSPVSGSLAGMSNRRDQHRAGIGLSEDQQVWKPRDLDVPMISANHGMRFWSVFNSFDGVIDLVDETLRHFRRPITVPLHCITKFASGESMKLDHWPGSARSSALTCSHGIPGEPSVLRRSNSSRNAGSSIDQPGNSSATESINSDASRRRSPSPSSIAAFRTVSRDVDIHFSLHCHQGLFYRCAASSSNGEESCRGRFARVGACGDGGRDLIVLRTNEKTPRRCERGASRATERVGRRLSSCSGRATFSVFFARHLR